MRVALVVGQFPCLSETFILTQLVELKRRGVAVHVFAWSQPDHPVRHALLQDIDLATEVTWWQPAPNGVVRRTWWALKEMMHALRHRPRALLRSLNLFRFGKRALSGSILRWTRQLSAKGPFDLCHAHFGPQGVHAERLLAVANPGLPLVVSFYGFDLTARLCQEQPKAYDALIRGGHFLLPLSEHFRHRLLAAGAATRQVRVHHLGVDPRRFACKRAQHNADRQVRVLSVGRFVEKKGFAVALRAVARARAAGVDLLYTLVGDGDLRPDFERLVAELDLEDVVQLTGSLSQEAVSELMQSSDILLAPSQTAPNGDEEGTPTVILEAMACGLPVVATTHAGIAEMVDEGVTGRLVPEQDEAALATALVATATRPETWAIMGAAGRRRVEAEFDATRLTAALVSIYEELIDQRALSSSRRSPGPPSPHA